MSECSGVVILQLVDQRQRAACEGLARELTLSNFKDFILSLGAKSPEGAKFEPSEKAEWRPVIENKKIADNLAELSVFGEEWLEICDFLHESEAINSWTMISSEYGYDVYSGQSAFGRMRGTVNWESGQDPEEDERLLRLQWHATMPPEVVARVVEPSDLEEALRAAAEHRNRAADEVSHGRRYFLRFGHRDGLLLKLRIKAKRRRVALRDALEAYIQSPTEAAFQALADYIDKALQGIASNPHYPDIHPDHPGPKDVAAGPCYVADDGNDLWVGFSADDIERYADDGCNDGAPLSTHIANLANCYACLADNLNGWVCIANRGYRERLSVHDGYIFLT